MIAQVLIITGSIILGLMGLAHFLYVLLSNKFNAFDAKTTQAMQNTSPVITKHTTMWKAWLGFNYSHSFGVLWIPLIYLPLALNHMPVLQHSMWLMLLLPIMTLIYAVLAKKYWFAIPLSGSLFAFCCFLTSFYLLHLK